MKAFDPAITDSLFHGTPAAGGRARRPKCAPELTAARVLCRQLARKRVSTEKKRIVHLICLNLLAVLKRAPERSPSATPRIPV